MPACVWTRVTLYKGHYQLQALPLPTLPLPIPPTLPLPTLPLLPTNALNLRGCYLSLLYQHSQSVRLLSQPSSSLLYVHLSQVPVIATLVDFNGRVMFQNIASQYYWGVLEATSNFTRLNSRSSVSSISSQGAVVCEIYVYYVCLHGHVCLCLCLCACVCLCLLVCVCSCAQKLFIIQL